MAQNAEHRRAAKAINFGIIYGQTPFGLAAQLGIDQKEAARFIAAYFARYRGVKKYLERSLAEARKTASRARCSDASGLFRKSRRRSPTCGISPNAPRSTRRCRARPPI